MGRNEEAQTILSAFSPVTSPVISRRERGATVAARTEDSVGDCLGVIPGDFFLRFRSVSSYLSYDIRCSGDFFG